MPRHRVLTALAALPLLALGAAPAHADTTLRYAALGDSYAAGVAAGAYDGASGECHRSTRAYPELWSAQHAPAELRHLACNGATVADVLRDQVPGVSADTSLVTLTAGGNDLGFSDAAVACLQPLTTDARCNQTLDESERRLREDLPARLDTLYRAVAAAAAPTARVVVTGYPHLLRTGTTCLIGTDPRRQRFNHVTDLLDEEIRRQAAAHGFAFADVRTAFEGHGVCSGPGQEWITGIVIPRLWESFHPTADGQARGYLPAVGDAVAAAVTAVAAGRA
ncbi:SGNH/GDSL hydrolase family protein [Kitasatospora sp. NPDC050543]|uniref:SGNH/GDSL hydrolase family protein n=1 Tax=Kitasatospora sp. NPDC050543 TaxID=3364054 RepID=UPI0037914B38